MNEAADITSPHGVPWPTSDERLRVPNTSMLPDTEGPTLQGIDRSDRTTDASVAGSRSTERDEWGRLRDTLRKHPLATLAIALAFGAMIVRATS